MTHEQETNDVAVADDGEVICLLLTTCKNETSVRLLAASERQRTARHWRDIEPMMFARESAAGNIQTGQEIE